MRTAGEVIKLDDYAANCLNANYAQKNRNGDTVIGLWKFKLISK